MISSGRRGEVVFIDQVNRRTRGLTGSSVVELLLGGNRGYKMAWRNTQQDYVRQFDKHPGDNRCVQDMVRWNISYNIIVGIQNNETKQMVKQ